MTENATVYPQTQKPTKGAFNLSGYSIVQFIVKNKNAIKTFIGVTFGAGGLIGSLTSGLSPLLSTAIGGFSGLVALWLGSLIDYWASENPQ